jgi:DNA-binding NtrC family response regulator
MSRILCVDDFKGMEEVYHRIFTPFELVNGVDLLTDRLRAYHFLQEYHNDYSMLITNQGGKEARFSGLNLIEKIQKIIPIPTVLVTGGDCNLKYISTRTGTLFFEKPFDLDKFRKATFSAIVEYETRKEHNPLLTGSQYHSA